MEMFQFVFFIFLKDYKENKQDVSLIAYYHLQ